MPVTIGLIASGVQAVGGLAQMFGSGKDKEQAKLERLAQNSPLKQQSKSISDYYQEAQNRYKENPYQSAAYQMAQLQANRSNAAGLSALGQSNMGAKLGGVGRMTQMRNDALQMAGAQAEGMKNQRFGQLGQATQLKQAEENQLFDINQMTPFNRQLGLQQYKTQAANERYNAGMGMVGQGIGNAANVASSYAYANPKTPETNSNAFNYGTQRGSNNLILPSGFGNTYGQTAPIKTRTW